MTRRDKEEMMELIETELMPLIQTLDIPADRAGLSEEWNALVEAASELQEALEELL